MKLNDREDLEINLARTMPQAAHRARAYNLEDNGASDLAHKRRNFKNRSSKSVQEQIEAERSLIERYKKRLSNPNDVCPSATIERWIAASEKRIRSLESGREELRPDATLIAPMTRRVAREDRKRAKKTKKLSKDKKNR